MKNTGNKILLISGAIGIIMILLALFVFGGINPINFEGLLGFSLIDINNPRLQCTETTCVWHWRLPEPVLASAISKEKIDLSLININQPITVKWRIDILSVEDQCESLLDDLRLDIEINDKFDQSFRTKAGVTQITDIQPFIDTNEGELEIKIGSEFCNPLEGLRYRISDGNFADLSSPTITFTRFGQERSMDELMKEVLNMTEQTTTKPCFGCGGNVISSVNIDEMCPILDCGGNPPPVVPPENLPPLTVSTGLATGIFLVLGIIIVAVVVVTIYIRRKSAPITDF